MKTSITFLIAMLFSTFGFTINENHITTNYILFETDKYDIQSDEKEKLLEIAQWLATLHDYKVQLNGHTDHDGSFEYNQALSSNRVDAVFEFFLEQGIEVGLISKDAFGERRPIDSKNELNRRVEIIVTEYYFESIDDLKKTIKDEITSHYQFNSNQGLNLECPNGVTISALPHSFTDSEGNIVDEPIHLEVIEAMDYSAFIANDLACISKDKYLESGGMAKITATTLSGQELMLKEGAYIEFGVPTMNVDDSMQLFVSDSGADWDLAATPKPLNTSQVNKRIDIDLEAPTRIKYERLSYPAFEFTKSSPKRPYKPIAPNQPIEPLASEFQKQLKWYQYFKRKSYNKASTTAYNKALRRFHLESAEYPSKIREFELKQAQYLIDSAQYTVDIVRFNNELQNALNIYYVERSNFFQDKNGTIQAEYELRRAEYFFKKDSILQASLESKENFNQEDSKMIQAYAFRSQNLGWVNCDRFRNMSPDEIFTVNLSNDQGGLESAFMIYTDVQSIIPMTEQNSQFTGKMKRSEEAMVFSMKIEDGKIWAYLENAKKINRDTSPNFKMVKYQELQEMLNNCYNENNSLTMN